MNTLRWIQTAMATLLLASVVACGGSDDDTAPVLLVDAEGISSIDAAALADALATYPLQTLSAAESASLALMREEEQLAHDVNALNATSYPQKRIFLNISESEATHSAAIKTLLDRYGLPDPLAGLPSGSFATPAVQALYDALVKASANGLVAALQVGLEIEELDIYDLKAQTAVVDNPDILMVYGNLQRASRNHLRAFWKVLTQEGGTYVPKYLTQDEFDAIVNSATEPGR